MTRRTLLKSAAMATSENGTFSDYLDRRLADDVLVLGSRNSPGLRMERDYQRRWT
jgi:hypothetical protein